MSSVQLSATASVVSILSFGLAVCVYPLGKFGTGQTAYFLWRLALVFAILAGLALLWTAAMAGWKAWNQRQLTLLPLIPLIALTVIMITWWKFYAIPWSP